MTQKGFRQAGYESQTSDARARRNDTNEYTYGKCDKCGAPTVAVNGRWLDCSMCEIKAKKQTAQEITAQANHTACLLAESMKDCGHCKFQPAIAPAWMIGAKSTAKEYEEDYAMQNDLYNLAMGR